MSTAARIAVATLVISVAQPAYADIAAVYLQGNGGVTGGKANDVPADNKPPNYGVAYGAQVGARILFGEVYVDHVAFTGGGAATRYVLGVRGGGSLGGIDMFGRAGVGYLTEQDGALAGGVEPMLDRRGAIARVGGGLEKSLSYGLHAGAALEGEYFRMSPAGASITGDQVRTGSDLFGYVYLKLQLGI